MPAAGCQDHSKPYFSKIRTFLVRTFLVRTFLVRTLLVRTFLVRTFLVRTFLVRTFLIRAFSGRPNNVEGLNKMRVEPAWRMEIGLTHLGTK